MANVNFMTLAVWRLFRCIAGNVKLSIFDIILTQFDKNSLFFNYQLYCLYKNTIYDCAYYTKKCVIFWRIGHCENYQIRIKYM